MQLICVSFGLCIIVFGIEPSKNIGGGSTSLQCILVHSFAKGAHMSLMKCPECSNEVSDSALSCPHCGVSIALAKESIAAGASLTTIQQTSKKFKMHTLIAVLLIIVGVVWIIGNSSDGQSGDGAIPSLLIFVGLVWFVITRLRTWWHHG